MTNERQTLEAEVTGHFLDDPNEDSFAALFHLFHPQVVSFFRARTRELTLAEDLAQEVMFAVYSKARQIRNRNSFRGWLFKIAHNALCRYYGSLTREVETVDLADVEHRVEIAKSNPAGTAAFEFREWMTLLDASERDVMILRFVEQWEYHEIAAARDTPIGTVQWRIFNSKKKLARHLLPQPAERQAA